MRGLCFTVIFFIVLNVSAFAQDLLIDGQSRTTLNAPSAFEPKKTKSQSAFQFDFSQQQYMADGQTEFQRRDYTNVGLDVDLRHEGPDISAGFHGLYQGTMQSGQEQYFGLPEAYFGESRYDETGIRWTVGRQKRHWSQFDEEFGMGIWQPQLRWDYLNPIQQGLTGLFWDFSPSKSVQMTAFASSLFLPDQGPNFSLQNGQFTSNNRWFWSPRTNVQIFNQIQPASFSLDMPPLSDVVFQPSLGGYLRFESRSTPWWAQVSYAYKPMNQMHLGWDCQRCVSINLKPTATIHPSVLMHRVATMEAGVRDDNQQGWVSVTSDVPTTPKGPSEWAQSDYSSVIFAGAAFAHSALLFKHPGWFKVSYLQAFEKEPPLQVNSLVDERVESSLDRYPFKQIAAAEWDWSLLQTAKNQLNLRTRYTYSIPERGSWLSMQLRFLEGNWNWNLSADILGAEIDPASSDAGLFTRYRENDRFSGGVGYVF